MWTPSIVELQVSLKWDPGLGDGFIGFKVDLLVFDGSPQPFDEGIVPPASLAVHGDADTVDFHQIGKGERSKLRALVGIEDLWCAIVVDGFLHGPPINQSLTTV